MSWVFSIKKMVNLPRCSLFLSIGIFFSLVVSRAEAGSSTSTLKQQFDASERDLDEIDRDHRQKTQEDLEREEDLHRAWRGKQFEALQSWNNPHMLWPQDQVLVNIFYERVLFVLALETGLKRLWRKVHWILPAMVRNIELLVDRGILDNSYNELVKDKREAEAICVDISERLVDLQEILLRMEVLGTGVFGPHFTIRQWKYKKSSVSREARAIKDVREQHAQALRFAFESAVPLDKNPHFESAKALEEEAQRIICYGGYAGPVDYTQNKIRTLFFLKSRVERAFSYVRPLSERQARRAVIR